MGQTLHPVLPTWNGLPACQFLENRPGRSLDQVKRKINYILHIAQKGGSRNQEALYPRPV